MELSIANLVVNTEARRTVNHENYAEPSEHKIKIYLLRGH